MKRWSKEEVSLLQLSFSYLSVKKIIPWLYMNSDDSIRLNRKYSICKKAI